MSCNRASTLLTLLACATLVAWFWWRAERFINANGPTFDEAAHLAAGYGYWTDGEFPSMEAIRARLPGQQAVLPTETRWKYSNLALTLAGLRHVHTYARARHWERPVGRNLFGANVTVCVPTPSVSATSPVPSKLIR